jgi:hypothetical protein
MSLQEKTQQQFERPKRHVSPRFFNRNTDAAHLSSPTQVRRHPHTSQRAQRCPSRWGPACVFGAQTWLGVRSSVGYPLVMLLATLSIATATLSGGATMFRLFFPKLSVIECAAAAAPIGLTLSAWLALLLKSFLFLSYVRHCCVEPPYVGLGLCRTTLVLIELSC